MVNPDEEHEKYFQKNPKIHERMSEETKIVLGYIQRDISNINKKIEPLSSMAHVQNDLIKELKEDRERILKLEGFVTKVAEPIHDILQKNKQRDKFVREAVLKIVAYGSLLALLGQNAKNLKDFIL